MFTANAAATRKPITEGVTSTAGAPGDAPDPTRWARAPQASGQPAEREPR